MEMDMNEHLLVQNKLSQLNSNLELYLLGPSQETEA